MSEQQVKERRETKERVVRNVPWCHHCKVDGQHWTNKCPVYMVVRRPLAAAPAPAVPAPAVRIVLPDDGRVAYDARDKEPENPPAQQPPAPVAMGVQGGVPVLAGFAAAPVAPVPPPVWIPLTYEGNARRYAAPVPSDDKRLQSALDHRRLKWFGVDQPATQTGHPISEAVRAHATVVALAKLYAAGCRNVISVYGNARDLNLNRILNKDVPEDDRMVLTVHRPMTVVEDAARLVAGAVEDIDWLTFPYDGSLLVDVYATCFAGDEEFCPDTLANLASHGPVAWVGHSFRAACGTVEGEGAWLRTADGIIAFADAEGTKKYGPHPPCDWLHTPGWHDGVAWTQAAVVSNTVVEWAVAKETKLRIRRQVEDPGFLWVDLPVPEDSWVPELIHEVLLDYAPSYVHWLPKQKRLVDLGLARDLERWLSGRMRTAHTWRMLFQEASTVFSRDPKWALLEKLFPTLLPDVREATGVYVFTKGAKHLAMVTSMIRAQHAERFQVYNTSVGAIDVPLNKWRIGRKLLIAGTALLGIWFLWKSRSIPVRLVTGDAVGAWARIKMLMTALWRVFTRLCGTTWAGVKRAAAVVQPRGPIVAPAWWTAIAERCKQSLRWCRWEWAAWRGAIADDADTIRGIWSEAKAKSHVAHEQQTLILARMDPISLLAGVILEEVIKHADPRLAGALVMFEAAAKFMAGETLQNILLVMVMHLITTRAPFLVGVAGHFAWNWIAQRNACAALDARAKSALAAGALFLLPWKQLAARRGWEQFRAVAYDAPWSERGVWTGGVVHDSYPALRGIVGKEASPNFDAKELDEDMVLKGKLYPEIEPRVTESMYVYLAFSVAMRAPGRTDANLLGVAQGRLLPAPLLAPRLQYLVWCDMPLALPVGGERGPMLWDNVLNPWLEHVKRDGGALKLRRMERALATNAQSAPTLSSRVYTSVQINVKTNEVLMKELQLKPRPISNVNPQAQAEVGPYVYEATQRLKTIWAWDPEPWQRGGWDIFLTFGSAATDKSLDRWMTRVLSLRGGQAAVLAAGDDSLVAYRIMGQLVFFEGDASAFDQSQSLGPLEYELRMQLALGVPDHVVLRERSLAQARYVLIGHDMTRLIIEHTERPVRVTGGANTTLGNTINMGAAWANIIARGAPSSCDEAIAAFRDLGFDMKMSLHIDPTSVTFLKGAWFEVKGRLRWGPLPSRVLKMGKILMDPRGVYHVRDYEEACRRHASDVAETMGPFLQTPLVAQFVARFRRPRTWRRVASLEPWQVGAEHKHPRTVMDWHSTAVRYGCSEDDLREVAHMIERAELFNFIAHPVLMAMARKDYA